MDNLFCIFNDDPVFSETKPQIFAERQAYYMFG